MSAEEIAEAMAGWSKYLSIQINQMEMGYKAARELDRGQVDVTLSLYGRLRHLLNRRELSIHINSKAGVEEALRKFFDYFPQARAVALERIWHSQEKPDSRWVEVEPAYTPKGGWRVMFNGRDLSYTHGLKAMLNPGDEIAIFPPGR